MSNTTPAPIEIDLAPMVSDILTNRPWHGKSLCQLVEESWHYPTLQEVMNIVQERYPARSKTEMLTNMGVASSVHEKLRDLAESLRI